MSNFWRIKIKCFKFKKNCYMEIQEVNQDKEETKNKIQKKNT